VWEYIDRTLLFDETWVLSSQWLKVTSHSLPSAWTYGDVSCKLFRTSARILINPNHLALVTISLPAPSYTIIVLSQLDSRYFTGLSGQSEWMFDFVLFEKGGTEVIAQSLHARFYSRSVNLEVALPEGEYVVHVRLDRQLDTDASTPLSLWSSFFFSWSFAS
jgi:hypothetical protein